MRGYNLWEIFVRDISQGQDYKPYIGLGVNVNETFDTDTKSRRRRWAKDMWVAIQYWRMEQREVNRAYSNGEISSEVRTVLLDQLSHSSDLAYDRIDNRYGYEVTIK